MDFYNKHYIKTREDGVITDGWSDGPHREKNITDAICINEKGGYQFRLILNGELTEENPSLYEMAGIPKYKYVNGEIVKRNELEIIAEKAAIPAPPPSAQEQLRADVDYIAAISGIDL